MALSGEAVRGVIEYALNNRPVDAALGGTMAIANRAGRVMTGMRDWFYLRTFAELDLVAGEDEVILPSNFGKLDEQEGSESIVGAVSIVSDAELLSLRVNNPGGGGAVYKGAIFSKPNPLPNGGASSWVVALDRPVAVSQIAAFTVVYRRTWDAITSDTSELRFPEFMDELYLQVVTAYAKDWAFQEADGTGISIEDRLRDIRAGVVFASAARDDQPQNQFGELSGGHVGGASYYRDWGSNATVDGI